MKKIIFLSLLGLFFLTGCEHKTNFVALSPEPIIEQTKTIERILPPNTGTYQEPKIIIWEATWIILAEINSKVQNEVSYTSTEEEKQNWRKESVVSWYVYTYIYEDLWIKITTPPLYEPYFYKKPDWLILKRKGNIIYLSWTPNIMPDYMEVFYKDPKVSLEDEIKQKHLPEWCTIQTGVIEKTNWLFSSMEWFNIIYIASKDWNLASNWEIFDKEFPLNRLSISFVMDPQYPEKYYKFSYGDCAPGPCSIFGKIEFF